MVLAVVGMDMDSRLAGRHWQRRAVEVVTWRFLVGVGLVGEVQMGFSGPVASGLVVGPTRRLWSTRCVVLLWRCIEVVVAGPAERLGPARCVALLWLC